jgi:hypothetical protein
MPSPTAASITTLGTFACDAALGEYTTIVDVIYNHYDRFGMERTS